MPFRWIPISNSFYKGASLLFMILLFILSSISRLPLPQVYRFQDLLFHAVAYGILYALVRKGFPRYPDLLILAVVVFYGFTDEFHQWFVPGRVFDIRDLAANTAGGTIIMILMRQSAIRTANRNPEG